jgi:spermidine synthase
MLAEMNAWYGKEPALKYIEEHAKYFPLEADAIRARYEYAVGHRGEAVKLLEKVFVAYRNDPWPSTVVTNRAVDLARELGQTWSPDAVRLFKAVEMPFAVHVLESARKLLRVDLAMAIPDDNACVVAFAALEPNPPWDERILGLRKTCYEKWRHPRAAQAAKDVEQFNSCKVDLRRTWLTCL